MAAATLVAAPAYAGDDAGIMAGGEVETDTKAWLHVFADDDGPQVHLIGEPMRDVVLPRELWFPLCSPEPDLRIPLISEVLPRLMGCPAPAAGG
ncbi:hypothetical protein ACFQ0B_15380 [Nonomuraea thailandensis]|uniref:hypothetical protein n=1 Tax=Nonomuraea thailandensis TaxID=1188745 RepID=UPI0020A40A6C|nr:hypothetical protein [Nonomuraea thailandensis]